MLNRLLKARQDDDDDDDDAPSYTDQLTVRLNGNGCDFSFIERKTEACEIGQENMSGKVITQVRNT